MFTRKLAALAIGIIGSIAAAQSHANPTQVSLELALLVDVSGSIDQTEFELQRDGYANAFYNPAIQTLIAQKGPIAVTYVQWSGTNQQAQSVGWTLVKDQVTAEAFADLIQAAPRLFSGNTAPGSAITWAVNNVFAGENGFEGTRNVIDVSGDGEQNEGASTPQARDGALNGTTNPAVIIDAINGLAIGDATLVNWYQQNIQGGADSFTLGVLGFQEFEEAIADKLGREIGGVPEPGSLLLFGAALAGFYGARRRISVA